MRSSVREVVISLRNQRKIIKRDQSFYWSTRFRFRCKTCTVVGVSNYFPTKISIYFLKNQPCKICINRNKTYLMTVLPSLLQWSIKPYGGLSSLRLKTFVPHNTLLYCIKRRSTYKQNTLPQLSTADTHLTCHFPSSKLFTHSIRTHIYKHYHSSHSTSQLSKVSFLQLLPKPLVKLLL